MEGMRQASPGEITVLQDVDADGDRVGSSGLDCVEVDSAEGCIEEGEMVTTALAIPGHHHNHATVMESISSQGSLTGQGGSSQPTKYVVIHLPIFHVAGDHNSSGGNIIVSSANQHHQQLLHHNSIVTTSTSGDHHHIPSSAVVLQQQQHQQLTTQQPTVITRNNLHNDTATTTSTTTHHTTNQQQQTMINRESQQQHIVTLNENGNVVLVNSNEHQQLLMATGNGGNIIVGGGRVGGSDGSLLGSYQCKECEKRFPKEELLRDHFRWHIEGEQSKSHRCDQCSATFSFKSNFQLHKRTCNVNGFKCSICDRVFSTRAQHSSHCRREHAAKPYGRSGKVKVTSASIKTSQISPTTTINVPNAVSLVGVGSTASTTTAANTLVALKQQQMQRNYSTSSVTGSGGCIVIGGSGVSSSANNNSSTTTVYVDVKHEDLIHHQLQAQQDAMGVKAETVYHVSDLNEQQVVVQDLTTTGMSVVADSLKLEGQ